jgi:hypothetical protein
MKNIIVVGELRSGYDTYTQRTDDFVKTLDEKLSFIIAEAQKNDAAILFIGGFKERNSDVHVLPTIIKQLYKVEAYTVPIATKKSGFTDILYAANCINDSEILGIEVHADPAELPLRFLKGTDKNGWVFYTGSYDDLVPMAELIAEAVTEKRIKGVITNSTKKTTDLFGVFTASAVFRKNEDSPAPRIVNICGDVAEEVEVQRNTNVFEYEDVAYQAGDSVAESDFVTRLKAETLLLDNSRDKMDSEIRLSNLIEDNLKKQNVSAISSEIVRSLMAQSI